MEAIGDAAIEIELIGGNGFFFIGKIGGNG